MQADLQAMLQAASAALAAGDGALAERLALRVLDLRPGQENALLVLAALRKGQGRLEEALGLAEQALRRNPNFFEALIQRGETLLLLERIAEAEAPLKKAQRLRPDSVMAVLALAFLYAKLGKAAEAEKLLRAGLRKQPDNPHYRNNLGQLLLHQLRYSEALSLLEPLGRGEAAPSEVFLNIANALVGLGRLDEAVEPYLQAIRRNPLNYFAHYNLNNVFAQLGRTDEIGLSFRLAKQALPAHPELLEMSAESNIAYSRPEQAEADLAEAARLRPDTSAQFRLWTALRLAQLRPGEAADLAGAGLQRQPQDLELWRRLAEAELMANRPEQALAAARRLAELDPFSQFAAAHQASALRLLGDHDAARRLYDYQRFVHAIDLAPPKGYADLDDYNRVLVERLEALHQARQEPVNQSLRHGTQTPEKLFDRPGIDPAIRQLGEAVLAAARRFMAQLPEDPAHPFLARKGREMDWAGSWSVRLGGGGFHTDHIHQEGWISGCYYVEIPDCVADEETKPGWLKFGEFKPPVGPALPWERAVRPRPGLLVLFPSYMWHGTLPITGSQPRMTVAFDIKPA
jgi:tetratricopeptide (TPR) repeat protein